MEDKEKTPFEMPGDLPPPGCWLALEDDISNDNFKRKTTVGRELSTL